MALAPQDLLFLKAATGAGAEASEAWLTISRELDLDSATAGQFGVLPLIYWNLSKHGVEHPDMPRLKGIYKYFWVENQMRLYLMTEAVARLRCEGIEPRVAGDVALTAGYFGDPGGRRIRSLRLEVADSERAEGLLAGLGWRAVEGEPGRFVRQDRRIGLVRLELGGFPPRGSSPEGQARRICLGGAPVEIPGPSEQLLPACIEAGRRGGPSPLGPAADFLVIRRESQGVIDWRWIRRRCLDERCDEALDVLLGLGEPAQS